MTAAVHQGGGWTSGGPADLRGVEPAISLEDRLSRIRQHAQRAPAECVAHLVGLSLAAAAFRSIDPQGPWLWWWCAALCLGAVRLGWRHALLRGLEPMGPMEPMAHESVRALRRWDVHNGLFVLLQGALTGGVCAWHEPLASGLHQSILLIIVFTWVLGAMPSMLDRLGLFAWHGVLTAGPLVTAVVVDTADAHHPHLVGSLVLFVGLVVWMFKGHLALVVQLQREKHRLEQLRLSLAQEAAQARNAQVAAQSIIRAKTQLMAATSHDLRQPLLALHLYARQLQGHLCEPGHRALVDGMVRSLQALETLSTDFLEDARLEGGAAAPCPQWVVLEPIFQSLAPQVGPCAFDRGLHLAWYGARQRVWGDPLMVERVLRNLILNAIEHTEHGGVLVGARRCGDQVRLQVWDSGSGLSPPQQARVFDDHYRVGPAMDIPGEHPGGPPTAAPKRRGTGLGLGIVRRLSHLMGATVHLRSQPGRGSVFEVVFRDPAPLGP